VATNGDGRVALREYIDEARTLGRVLSRVIRYRPTGKRSVPELLEARASEYPTRTAILFGDERFTYGDWNAQSNRVAHWALGQGLRRGDVVALLMDNRPEYLFVWSGLSKLGVVTALINTNLTGQQLDHALSSAHPTRLVVGAELLGRLATASSPSDPWILRDRGTGDLPPGAHDLDRALQAMPSSNPDSRVRSGLLAGDDLLYIYTSGTTGNPKAARFSHLRFLAIGDVVSAYADARSTDVFYDVLPLYHTAGGVMVPAVSLFSAATLVVRRRFSATQFWEDVRRYGVTSFQYIGELCRYLLAQPESPRDREHALRFTVGNGLRPDVWAAFRDRFAIPRIHEFYGSTEGNVTLMNLDNHFAAVGRVLLKPLSNARIVRYDVERDEHPRDARGRCIEAPRGEVGEAIGRLPFSKRMALGRFEGYTSNADSDRKLLRDVFRKGDSWYRTGDLLRQDSLGYFYFVDRIGDTYRWKGENVSTQEVAEILGPFPGVHTANVYGVALDGHDGRAGMVSLVMTEGARFDGPGFFAFVSERLPRYAAPVFVRIQAQADLTGTFKLRKVDLQRQGFDPAVTGDPIFVRDTANRTYARVVPELLAEIRTGALVP
jgi:fatty-acyl-CoA synthase